MTSARLLAAAALFLFGCGSDGGAPGDMEELRGAPAELDPSFGDGGIVRLDDVGLPVVSKIAVQPNGRILVVGSAGDEMVVARFLPDGPLDTEFGEGIRRIRVGEPPVYPRALVVLGDGRILVGGSTAGKALLLRLSPSGDRDATFGTDGVVVDTRNGAPPVNDVALDASGRIVVAGTTDGRAALTRYRADGSPDASFGASGIALPAAPPSETAPSSFVGSVIVQQDGSIVAGGGSRRAFGPNWPILVRLDPDARAEPQSLLPDPDHPELNAIRTVVNIVEQLDGRFAITMTDAPSVALFERDGSPVRTFGTNGISPILPHASLGALAIDGRGRAVAAGSFVRDPQRPTQELAVGRFTTDGFPDPTFDGDGLVVTPFDGESQGGGIAVQLDDRIVVKASTEGCNCLLRYFGGEGVVSD